MDISLCRGSFIVSRQVLGQVLFLYPPGIELRGRHLGPAHPDIWNNTCSLDGFTFWRVVPSSGQFYRFFVGERKYGLA